MGSVGQWIRSIHDLVASFGFALWACEPARAIGASEGGYGSKLRVTVHPAKVRLIPDAKMSSGGVRGFSCAVGQARNTHFQIL